MRYGIVPSGTSRFAGTAGGVTTCAAAFGAMARVTMSAVVFHNMVKLSLCSSSDSVWIIGIGGRKATPATAVGSTVRDAARACDWVSVSGLEVQQCPGTRCLARFAPRVVERDQSGHGGLEFTPMGTWHRVEIMARIEQYRFGFVVTREGNERGAEQALRCADAPVVFEEGRRRLGTSSGERTGFAGPLVAAPRPLLVAFGSGAETRG